MDISEFSRQNRARSRESFPGSKDWKISDWIVALVGEVGEAANIHKKIIRGDHKTANETVAAMHAFHKELADVFAYLDLLAESAGVSLETIVIDKWNEVSERVGSSRRIGHRVAGKGKDEFFFWKSSPQAPIRHGHVALVNRGPGFIMDEDQWQALKKAREFFGMDVAEDTSKTGVKVFSGGRRNGRTFAMDALMGSVLDDRVVYKSNEAGTGFIKVSDHVKVSFGSPSVGVKVGRAEVPPVIANGSLVRFSERSHTDIGILLERGKLPGSGKGWFAQNPFGERVFVPGRGEAHFKAASEFDRVLWTSLRACRAMKLDRTPGG